MNNFADLKFFGRVGKYPIFFAQEYGSSNSLYTFYFDGKDIKEFKSPLKNYHKSVVFNMDRTGKFMWSVDCKGYLNRYSLE